MTQSDTVVGGPPSKPPRLVALDAFRGATIGAMILVNNPGSWSHTYPPLRHAAWHGCTPTDLIFPFFLFIVGVAMAYALPRHLSDGRPGLRFWSRVVRRVVLLVLLGLLLNAFVPIWRSVTAWDWAATKVFLAQVRLPGVLQRIGLVYLLACVVVVFLRVRTQITVSLLVLVLCPVLMITFVPADPFGPHDNLARAVDRWVIPASHLYSGSPTDPEGLLGTLPALITTLIGYWCGVWLRTRPAINASSCMRLIAAGALLATTGLATSILVPFNKPLWTSSYVLYTGGWAIGVLGLSLLACDLWRLPTRKAWALLGRHAITVFVASGILARVLILVPGPNGAGSVKDWMFAALDNLLTPLNASLAFAMLTVLVWWLIAWSLDRAGIILKV